VGEKYCSFVEKVWLIRQANRARDHRCLKFTCNITDTYLKRKEKKVED